MFIKEETDDNFFIYFFVMHFVVERSSLPSLCGFHVISLIVRLASENGSAVSRLLSVLWLVDANALYDENSIVKIATESQRLRHAPCLGIWLVVPI